MDRDDQAVELTGVSKRFGRVPAVAGLDLTVRAGQTVALLGPNGAGKTTTIRLLLGLIRPDAGAVAIGGTAPARAIAAGRVGAMLQGGRLPTYATVAELVSLARALYPRPLPAAEILTAAGLTRLADRRLDRLSGGEQQRARFALALAGGPDLLVLDEPTAGMDATSRHAFWTAVRGRVPAGRTVLFATHYLAEADAYADRVVVMAGGGVVADGPAEEIRRTGGSITAAYLALTDDDRRSWMIDRRS